MQETSGKIAVRIEKPPQSVERRGFGLGSPASEELNRIFWQRMRLRLAHRWPLDNIERMKVCFPEHVSSNASHPWTAHCKFRARAHLLHCLFVPDIYYLALVRECSLGSVDYSPASLQVSRSLALYPVRLLIFRSILVGLLLWNYFLCVVTDPGRVPDDWVGIWCSAG